MGRLTSAEKRVARVLLASYPIAGLESVSALAARANVSMPTVTRFVNRLGIPSFADFRRLLREEVQNQITTPVTLYDRRPAGLTEHGIFQSSLKALIRNLDSLLRTMPDSEFQAVIDLLSDRRHTILCTGGRETHVLANYFFTHLHMLRERVHLVPIGPSPRSDALIDVGKKHVVIVFDYRRYQDDTIRLAREAQSRGASIVLFTDPWLSPIAEFAVHVVSTPVDNPSPFNSQVGALATVEALLAGIAIRLGDGVRLRMQEIEDARHRTSAVGEPGTASGPPPATRANPTKNEDRHRSQRRQAGPTRDTAR